MAIEKAKRIFRLENTDTWGALAVFALLILGLGALNTCAQGAHAGEWQNPTASLYLGLEKDNDFGEQPVATFQLEECYRFDRKIFNLRPSACGGYIHHSSAPLLDDETIVDMLYLGFTLEIEPW